MLRYPLPPTRFAYFNPLLATLGKNSPYIIPWHKSLKLLSVQFQLSPPLQISSPSPSLPVDRIGRTIRFETHPRNSCAITRGPEPDRYRRSTKRRRADRGEIHEEGHTTAARDFTQQAHRIVKESGGTTLYRGGGTPGARRRLHPPNGTREERKMEEEEENRREMWQKLLQPRHIGFHLIKGRFFLLAVIKGTKTQFGMRERDVTYRSSSHVSSSHPSHLASFFPSLLFVPRAGNRWSSFFTVSSCSMASALIPQALGLYRGADLATENSGNVLIVKWSLYG